MMQDHNLGEIFTTIIKPNYMKRTDISEHTKDNTLSALRKLCDYSGKEVIDITEEDAIHFYNDSKMKINEKKYEELYVKTYMHQLRSLYQYIFELYNSGIITEQNPCIKCINPFRYITIDISDKMEYTESDFISLETVDNLLSCCDTPSLELAVCLAFQLCMSLNEIANLTKEQVIFLQDESCHVHIPGKNKDAAPRYLQVPDDLKEKLCKMILTTPSDYPYVLTSKRGKHCSERTLQYLLQAAVNRMHTSEENVTFQALRNLGIKIIMSNGASINAVADYTGLEGRWLYRYSQIPYLYRYDMTKFHNISIISRF